MIALYVIGGLVTYVAGVGWLGRRLRAKAERTWHAPVRDTIHRTPLD